MKTNSFPYIFKITLFALTVMAVVACEQNKDEGRIYLSGKIVNPHTDQIRLFQNGNLIDSVPLTQNGRFYYKFPKGVTGLIKFIHPPESQLFFIEPGDSLLLRLNTMKFDETLTFTGEGAAKNNYLIHQFLQNEDNDHLIYSYYKRPPKFYIQAIDSILGRREAYFELVRRKQDFSKAFVSLALKNIRYEYYNSKERYYFLLRKYFSQRLKKLPTNYLEYRQNIDVNDPQVAMSYIYQRFLDNYLKNLSVESCKNETRTRACYRLRSFNNTLRRLKLSDSLFRLDYLRNKELQHFAKLAVFRANYQAQVNLVKQLVKEYDYKESAFSELREIAKVQQFFLLGHDFSGLRVRDVHGNTFALGKRMKNKPKVLFFWSLFSPKAQEKAHKKALKLQEHFPGIQFIAINIDAKKTKMWKSSVKNFGYVHLLELQLQENPYDPALFEGYSKRFIVLSAEGDRVIENELLNGRRLVSELHKIMNNRVH